MVDFINSEQRLLKAQLSLVTAKKQKETLSMIDNHLSRLQSVLPETVNVSIKGSELLSSDGKLTLPLKVRGRFLGVGRHKIRYYTEEELKKSIKDIRIPFKVDHRNKEAGATIGAVYKIYWDDVEKAIRYEGHINDETQARNILDGVVKEVSATIFADQTFDRVLGILGKNLEYGELSLVEDGAYKGNTLEAVL